MTNAAPGWYPDAHLAGTVRYWNGEAWTEHVAPAAAAAPPVPQLIYTVRVGNGLATTSLVFGILAVLPTLTILGAPLGVPAGIVGVCFAIAGLRRARRIQYVGRNVALWGFWLSLSPMALLFISGVVGAANN